MTTYMMQAVASTTGALVAWQSSTADFAAAGYPGPGSATHVAVAGRTGGGSGLSIAKFPNDLSPFALWNFENDLLDTSGNGRHLTAGSSRYIDIYPGFVGRDVVPVFPATRTDQAFNIPGDITILAMIQANAYTPFSVLAFSSPGTTLAFNYIYSFGPYVGTRQLQYFSEHGNANANVTFNGDVGQMPYIHNLAEIGMTYISGVVQFWINGRKSGAPSSIQIAPDGGTSSSLNSGIVGDGTIGAIKFWDRGLTDAEIVQQYNVTMGGAFGTV